MQQRMSPMADSWPQVTDPEDPRLAALVDLPTRRGGSRGPLVAEGAIVVQRALAGPCAVMLVVGTASQLARLERGDLPEQVLEASAAMLSEVMGFDFHRGVVALVERPPRCPPQVEAVLARETWTALLVERLADPANVGAIVRTAAALGTDLVVCDAAGADPYTRRALRASMGHALVALPWVCDDLRGVVRRMQDAGATVLAATLDARSADVATVRRPAKLGLVVGNEGQGITPSLVALCDGGVMVPVAPGTDSLNVAAATAILLHSLRPRE